MPAWKFYVSATLPGAPTLSGPVTNKVSNNPTPTFIWKAGTNADTYEIQISTGLAFASTVQDATTSSGSLTYLANALADGKYYWRVRSISAVGAASAWTNPWIITIDTQAPSAPTLVGPADNTTTTNPSLTLRWNASTGATRYEIALDTKNPPQTPAIPVGNVTSYLISWPHTVGITYYWEVRAIDAADNVSDWSAVYSFKLVAGMSSASIRPTPTVDLTNEATSEVTVEATSTPVAISSPLITVEAENANVNRTGDWTAQESSNASGGSYLYSSGKTGDALTLRFTGAQIKVVYVKYPAFGSFAIDVDGVAQQTITAAAAEASFGAEMTISGLAAGSHTLRVYAVDGTVALDAFQVEGVTTSSNTAIPTPKAIATQKPAATPTDMPTGTPIAPSPAPVPLVIVEAESASVVKSGNWTEQATSSASGGSYLYSSGKTGDALTLTFKGSHLDILYLQHPALGTFAIAIDGTPVKVITETGPQAFGLHETFSGLSTGIHAAHIYPVNGVIAIDSFFVEPQTISVPVPTPTQASTSEPTTPAAATPEPSATPIPATKSAISTPQPPTIMPTANQISTLQPPTNIPTLTETPTASPTWTETPTETPTASLTETSTASPTWTETSTETPTP